MKSEFLDVPDGQIAAVVTHLQMFRRPAPRDVPQVAATLKEHAKPDLDWYRDLFSRVGADWMWFSRQGMADDALASVLHDDDMRIFSVDVDGRAEGLLELDFRIAGQCELGIFGLTQAMIGAGAGRWLMEQALDLAWAQPIERFHVHTCTLDSAQALPFYMRSGFTAYRRQIEIADDPRKIGVLPANACPQAPVI